ncbi:MAG: amino acid adenylation domain-containing protein, partial [Phaeodactylibacter sp.]|nr:amino acid adenylation domain-containing protein [Phaeodactylibacter sp.]
LEVEQSGYNQFKQEIEAQIAILKEAFLSQKEQLNIADNIEDVYPMSDIQKGMVFGNLLYENQGVYHDQAVYALGHIGFEKARFEKALQLMVDKHPNLRTVFRLDQDGEDLQVVFKTIPLPLSYHKTQTFHKDELELELGDFLKSERRKGFGLANGPLWRMKIFQAEASKPILVFQFHHSIFDGWSLASFNTELLQVYHRLQSNPAYQPEKLNLTYKDFVVRELIIKKDESIRDFWRKELEGYERMDLFTEKNTDDEFEIDLGKAYLEQLEALASQYQVSVKMLALSAYLVLLDNLNPQSEPVIGTISTNRLPEAGGDQLLGCFLNSVPLRIPLDQQSSLADFIRQVDKKMVSLRGKDQLTALEIARLLGENSVEGNPIFDVIFNYIDFHIYEGLDDIGLSVEKMMQPGLSGIPTFFERTNTWFDLMVNTTGHNLALKVQLSRKLKARYSAKETLYKYLRILDAIIEAPDGKVVDISFLGDREHHQLLHTFNDTAAAYPEDQTVVDLFEEQAAKTPDKPAIVFDNTTLSYQELEQRSRQLALYLQTQGVKADTLVGISMEHSVEMIVAILGILRAGGAYVPLDPGYPKERLVHMIQEGLAVGNAGHSANIILTQSHLKPALAEHTAGVEVAIVELAEQWGDNPAIASLQGDLLHRPSPQDLIYVIFTSGSTGKPKGTLVKHQGFFNLMHWYLNDFEFHADSKFLLVSSINFDLTQKNFYAPLLLGGSLHLSSAENYDLAAINQVIQEQQITNINCTPTIFYGFVDQAAADGFESLRSLEYVFLGGEPINLGKLNKWFNNPHNKAQLVNSYGPTECSDVVSAYTIEHSSLTTIPIGKPICNTQLYILDKHERLVPVGVQGELCISGKGVGRGYLNNPELTHQKFVLHPFKPGELLYKTGDLARWLPDGNIEFLGRADHQLKIRGYRIEAGEIEDVLLQHPAVHSAIVVGKEITGNKELVAYLVAGEGKLPSLEALRNHLSQQLPNYMIPACFVEMKALPLTPSGKVNKLALPEPEASSLASGGPYVAPRTRTEAALARIWEEVLQRSSIGIYDDFFALGGHSLKVIRLVSLIQERLLVSVKLSEVFAQPTVAALAAQISGKARIEVVAIEPAEPQENYALSNAQRRLWVLGQMDEDQVAYNMPMVIQLKGKLHVEALQAAFNHLIARHESLRTNIITVNGVPRQVIHPVRKVEIHLPTWQEKGEKALSEYILSFARQPFNLADGALLRLELLQMQEGAHPEESGQALLLLNMHHIISDGWSMEILLRELSHLYDAYIEEEAHALPALRIQYKDYAAWQNALLEQSELMEDLRNYWFQKLAPIEEGFPILELPADYPRPAVQSYQGAILSTTLSPQLLDDLEALSRSSGTTLYITLTAIVKALLYRYSGQRDIIIGSLSAGRNHADLEHQIGFYVNTLALRDYIAEGTNFIEFLAQVKQTSVEAIGHELYPFDRLVEELDLIRDTSRAPLFDVLIAIQNEESPVLKFGGSRAALESVDWQVSKFDLSFGFTPTSKGLVVDIEYSTDLYKPERIHRMFEHLECLIQSLLANSNQPVEKLSILPKAEQSRLLQEFSFIAADYNLDKTIHQLFEEQVEKTPDNVAVVFEDKELSYRVLNERANALAHYLRDNYDIKGDEIVALQVDRSDWMMVALLGTMKSGAAYLPIAPDCPENRTEYMLRDSGARLLLTDRS